MGILIGVLKSVGTTMLTALLTEKVAMKLIIVMLEKLIKMESTGPALDKALIIVREELEKANK